MTIRASALALALATLGALGCSPTRIPGTAIVSTPDTRAVYEVVLAYRQAMEKRDVAGVLALVAPNYFDTAGTPDPSDDLDRPRLEVALKESLARTDEVRLDFTVRKIDVSGDQALAELFYESYYRVKTPTGTAIPRRDSDLQRMVFQRQNGAWKIVSGL
jgi:hypothetical protein